MTHDEKAREIAEKIVREISYMSSPTDRMILIASALRLARLEGQDEVLDAVHTVISADGPEPWLMVEKVRDVLTAYYDHRGFRLRGSHVYPPHDESAQPMSEIVHKGSGNICRDLGCCIAAEMEKHHAAELRQARLEAIEECAKGIRAGKLNPEDVE